MIVVNFATSQFSGGQKRLRDSLGNNQALYFSDYGQIGSPTHGVSPYEFKLHAIKKAWEKDNIVLWADASMYLKGDLSKIETIIKQDGYFMEEAGHYVKDWCNQQTLDYFGITRDTPYIMFSAGLLGLDSNNPLALQFFDLWMKSAKAGHFKGEWKDHRHDMTCGSIIAQQLQMKYQRGASHLAYIGPGYSQPEAGVVFYCQGFI